MKITRISIAVLYYYRSSTPSAFVCGHESHDVSKHHERVAERRFKTMTSLQDNNNKEEAELPVLLYGNSTELFEEDIIPSYGAIYRAYGQGFADELVKKGLMEKPSDWDQQRDAVRDSGRWTYRDSTDNRIIIPYVFQSGFSSTQIQAIRNAANILVQQSGERFKFVQRTNQANYISYSHNGGSGCSSYIGMVGRGQTMTIGWCASLQYTGSIIHEHLHALGFYHEQSRPDRDNHVRIEFKNIQPNKEHNFAKADNSQTMGLPYDHSSIMHYHKTAFGISGRQTIFTLPNGQYDNIIGRGDEMSSLDLEGLKLLYQCTTGSRTQTQFLADPCNTNCKCALNELGCHKNGVDNSDVCMGSLGCFNNRCVRNAPTPRPNAQPPTRVPTAGPPTVQTYFTFKNYGHPGKCMDLDSSKTDNGSDIIICDCSGNKNQQWRMDSEGYIRSAVDDSKCLTPAVQSTADGTDIVIWTCISNFSYQKWINNFGQLRAKSNFNQCIGVENSNSKHLQIFQCNGSYDEQWIKTPIGTSPTPRPTLRSTPRPTLPPTPRPTPRPISSPTSPPRSPSVCGTKSSRAACRKSDCCKWKNSNKKCVEAPCVKRCGSNKSQTNCTRDVNSCCTWGNGKCKPQRRCGNCKKKNVRKACIKDGCCDWIDGNGSAGQKCFNKDICIRGKRRVTFGRRMERMSS